MSFPAARAAKEMREEAHPHPGDLLPPADMGKGMVRGRIQFPAGGRVAFHRMMAMPGKLRFVLSTALFSGPDLEQFEFEALRVSNHTACRFAEKALFFRLLLAGRRCVAASRFTFFKVETL